MTTDQHLARMIRLMTHDDHTGNPYRHEPLMDALRHLAATGVDPFDVNTEAIADGLPTLTHRPDQLHSAAREVQEWRDTDGAIGTAKERAAFSALDHAIAERSAA